MRRLRCGDVSQARLKQLRLVRQIGPDGIRGLAIGRERLSRPLDLDTGFAELQPLGRESGFPLFEGCERRCMFLFAAIQVVESGLELRDRGLVRIEGQPQFFFAVAQIFRPFLQNLLPPRELAFFSLKGDAVLLQRLLPSRQDRRGFRDFSLKLRQAGLVDLRGLFLLLDRFDLAGDRCPRCLERLPLGIELLSRPFELGVPFLQFGSFLGFDRSTLLQVCARRDDGFVLSFDGQDPGFQFRLGGFQGLFPGPKFFFSLFEGFRSRPELTLPSLEFIGLSCHGGPFRLQGLLSLRKRALGFGEVPFSLGHCGFPRLRQTLHALRGLDL